MLSILDRAVMAYAGAGLKLLSLGKRYVVAYWVAQLIGLGVLIYECGFWWTVGYVLIPLNIVSAIMMWRANQIDTERQAEIIANSIVAGMNIK